MYDYIQALSIGRGKVCIFWDSMEVDISVIIQKYCNVDKGKCLQRFF